ncbi:conserved protein of unknown function [Limnospira indica PCC 8005]|uniref:Uncharacterized protein n=1 Tax=Limnospira indica PCC 8005 TaxID=376219 RepID=A0A9P1KJC7_9CYAN|nr:conserved protein of unknown function [Limnospira indica PCC 8005]
MLGWVKPRNWVGWVKPNMNLFVGLGETQKLGRLGETQHEFICWVG